MKDTYNYPKTLRNYEEQSSKQNKFSSPLHNGNNNKALSQSAHHHQKKFMEEQQHNVGQYYILTNPSQFKAKQTKLKKDKNKSKSKQSHFSQALKQQLNKPLMTHSQIGPTNILHCKSLQKLQIISNDRGQQIKALINQKAFLISENQDLKIKLINPTYRQQQFVQKIAQREFEIQNLKQQLRRKDQIIGQIQKEYKVQIQRIKVKHREQIATLREQINKIRLQKINQTSKKLITHSTSNDNIYKTQTIQSSYNNTIESKPVTTKINDSYKITQQKLSPNVVNSTNYNSSYNSLSQDKLFHRDKSPLKQTSNSNDSKQTFRTYIGDDGYERRVYYKNKQNQENTKLISNAIDNKNTYLNNNYQNTMPSGSISTPFTNQKISTYVSKQIQPKNSYQYSLKNKDKNIGQYDNGFHNQNLYSNSLTFQCFSDS